MPKRVAKPKLRPRYTSKEYRAYEAAWNRLSIVETFSADLINASRQQGFAARFLRKPGTPPPPPKPRVVPDIPSLRPYHRHERYVIPKDWPKTFFNSK